MVKKHFFDILVFLHDRTLSIKTSVLVKRKPREQVRSCMGAYRPYFCKETDILMERRPSPLISDSRIDMQGPPSFWFPFTKAIITGTISLVHNWTFYKEIAVVYLLSFYSIRAILLPWKHLRFTIIWHCCSYWSTQRGHCQITLSG